MYTAKGRLDVNAMLKQYSPLVRRLAHQMIAKLPANVELDDLIQVGMIGLTDALSRFDAAQGVQFETFATQRIRGAMLDELRGNDWMSRGDRRHQRSIEAAVRTLEQRLGRAPERKRDRRRDGHDAGRLPGAAGQGARHAAGVPGGHERRRRRRRLPRPPRRQRRAQPAGAAAGPAHAPGAGRGHQEPARARAVRDEHVLRARHEPEGDRRGARRHRKPRLPAAQPVDRAAARQAARVVGGQGDACIGRTSNGR